MTINHKDFKKCSIEYFDAAFYYFLSTYLGKRKFYKNFQKRHPNICHYMLKFGYTTVTKP